MTSPSITDGNSSVVAGDQITAPYARQNGHPLKTFRVTAVSYSTVKVR